ncbi:MAG: nucleoside recognition domain-containing protein [Gammaproteobacteria bacterium]
MSGIGLPGNAFVPLIVGFGCNVPAVMAARSLGRESDRLLTISMAPFMSCGARLTVYALFAAALFPENGQNIVFGLYLLGIAMAVLTGWLFRKQIFPQEMTPSFQEMPAYHAPVLRNILLTTWFRLKSFVLRAGRTIVLVVVGLSFLNSIGTDGSVGNEDSERSVLAAIGKSITPVFAPIGLERDNWPATVGLFTGLFAKEAVVGTLDALYSEEPSADVAEGAPALLAATGEALLTIRDNTLDMAGTLTDPLGIQLESSGSLADAAESQGVTESTLTQMAALFVTPFAAFCYLVFVLLYAPCVAVLGAISKEAGAKWMLLTFAWTTGLAYVTASSIYQIGMLTTTPVFSTLWLAGCIVVSVVAVRMLRNIGRKSVHTDLINVVQTN